LEEGCWFPLRTERGKVRKENGNQHVQKCGTSESECAAINLAVGMQVLRIHFVWDELN
jgi:hypothetical protein